MIRGGSFPPTAPKICIIGCRISDREELMGIQFRDAAMKIVAALAASACLGAAGAAAQAPAPLAKAVAASIQDCPAGGTVVVPIITWGGDIPTIHANGGKAATAAGSIFGKAGLALKLAREDVFSKQVESYLRCETPYLRGTAGMIAMASETANRDPRTKMVVVYQLTWSAGGDALVVKGAIRSPKELKGKTIAVQSYGPHVDYLGKVLADAGLSFADVRLRWCKDLTGTDKTPGKALGAADVDAAMVISPDAMALTSGGTVGTGAEDSVKGAKILLTTKSANRIIADVYAVRSDYFEKNREDVEKFVRGLLAAQEEVKALFKGKDARRPEYNALLAGAGQLLLDSAQAVKDVEGLYGDAEFAGYPGNVQFFATPQYPRSFERLMGEIQSGFVPLGLLGAKQTVGKAGWDFASLQAGLKDTAKVTAPRFDEAQVARVVSERQKKGNLDDSGLFSFEVFFKPNQAGFPTTLYEDSFKKAIDLASTYGGAVMTVEGHSDPLGYLRKVKEGEVEAVLKRQRQAALNLSLSRAIAVRDTLVAYGKQKGITLDPSQFAVVGQGITKPRSGMCGSDPCAPKSEKEWLDNMRVEFRIIQVEAEEAVFKPL
ncbi:MAG: ABC transporter substrate-binding protein [Elusimicrobia bacterium]|nr:ABC transporter substrate-binding protein [Elusimicrobiota bacterium]